MIGLEDSVQPDDVFMVHGSQQGDLVVQTGPSSLFLREIRLKHYLSRKDLLILDSAYFKDAGSAALSDLFDHLVDMLKAYLIDHLPELPYPNFRNFLEGHHDIRALLFRVDQSKPLKQSRPAKTSTLLEYSLKLDVLSQRQCMCILQLLFLGAGEQKEVILENNFILFLRGVFQDEKGGKMKGSWVDWQQLRLNNGWKEFCDCFWL